MSSPARADAGHVSRRAGLGRGLGSELAGALALMFTTPRRMLCPVWLLVGGAGEFPAAWTGGDGVTDDDLCVARVRVLGNQYAGCVHCDRAFLSAYSRLRCRRKTLRAHNVKFPPVR